MYLRYFELSHGIVWHNGSQAKAKLKAAAPKKSILAQSAYAYSYLRYVHTK